MKNENIIRNNSRLYIIYVIGTIIFILVMFLSIKQNVMGIEQKKHMDFMLLVDQEELDYVKDIEGELSKYGLINSGVTMTKTIEGEGNFHYNIQIHHRNLNNVSLEEKNAIVYSLKNLSNEIENLLKTEGMAQEVCFLYEII